MTTINKKNIACTAVLFMEIAGVFGQQKPPPPTPQTLATPPPGLPIDNGLIILFAIAIIYGVYKIVQCSKKAA
ncbi:hypothetical protein MWU76_02530 [Gelidibacter sp. F2691]|nr:hypothetical protein [Gelidibacter sp. F2691]